MFPRISRVSAGGKTYEYLRIVESYRDRNGKMKQRVVGNLGRLDQLDGKLDSLVDKLRAYCQEEFLLPKEIENEDSVSWGEILVARHLWEQLQLDGIIGRLCQGRHQMDIAERAFVLVANRLSQPKSEHGMARWLEHTYVCDGKGGRYEPEWLEPEKITKEQRVKVTSAWLNRWYRTLDAVYAHKKQIEQELYLRLRDLFSMAVEMVFYDITSLYFERREPKGRLRRHGYPRGGNRRNVQVLLGTVVVDGFPIASHIFEGNRNDATTVQEVVLEIRERFGLKKIIFVGDKGMVSPKNLELFESLEQTRYLLGHRGRRDEKAQLWLSQISEQWIECGKGTRVQEVPSGEEGLRVFVCESEEREAYERRLRERSMKRAEGHLKKVAEAVEKGRLKKADKIGARAARALQKDKGYRYFSYEVPAEGKFYYLPDEEKLQAESSREGRYLLTTDDPHLDPRQAVHQYKELSDLEEGFRIFKDIIEGRPIFHRKEVRICAHLFIAQLALLLMRQLRRHLETAGVALSAPDAFAAMKSLGVTVLKLNGRNELMVARAKRDARTVLKTLGITNWRPPTSTETIK